MNGKKLYKSSDDVVLSGVLGGLAEYLNTDPFLIRFLFVISVLSTNSPLLLVAYILATLIIPEKPRINNK